MQHGMWLFIALLILYIIWLLRGKCYNQVMYTSDIHNEVGSEALSPCLSLWGYQSWPQSILIFQSCNSYINKFDRTDAFSYSVWRNK